MGKKRTFKFQDAIYDIPEEEVEGFLSRKPKAIEVESYTVGKDTFDVPLDVVGTEFQVAAWRALADIPFGSTASYAQQAASIGRPTATRAIGAANGRNPVVVVLPCHRVIGANGSLTGFGGGLPVKKWLLEHETEVVARQGSSRA